MTLSDISRLLKYANVPQSKVVECMHPSPAIEIHVPMTHFVVMTECVRKLQLFGQVLRVIPLTSNDVRRGEHVYVKVTGSVAPAMKNVGASSDEQRRQRMATARVRNSGVVVQCAWVIA